MEATRRYRTAEAARLLDVHPQTLRLWERKGVIEPATRQRGKRIYTVQDIDRIRAAVIQHPATPPEKGDRP
jgi:DNA-binding transcriptional MerR regulator